MKVRRGINMDKYFSSTTVLLFYIPHTDGLSRRYTNIFERTIVTEIVYLLTEGGHIPAVRLGTIFSFIFNKERKAYKPDFYRLHDF
jgi:hypothetical protein